VCRIQANRAVAWVSHTSQPKRKATSSIILYCLRWGKDIKEMLLAQQEDMSAFYGDRGKERPPAYGRSRDWNRPVSIVRQSNILPCIAPVTLKYVGGFEHSSPLPYRQIPDAGLLHPLPLEGWSHNHRHEEGGHNLCHQVVNFGKEVIVAA